MRVFTGIVWLVLIAVSGCGGDHDAIFVEGRKLVAPVDDEAYRAVECEVYAAFLLSPTASNWSGFWSNGTVLVAAETRGGTVEIRDLEAGGLYERTYRRLQTHCREPRVRRLLTPDLFDAFHIVSGCPRSLASDCRLGPNVSIVTVPEIDAASMEEDDLGRRRGFREESGEWAGSLTFGRVGFNSDRTVGLTCYAFLFSGRGGEQGFALSQKTDLGWEIVEVIGVLRF